MEKEKKVKTVRLEKDLTIKNIAFLKEQITAEVKKGGSIKVVLKPDGEIDVSGLQLIISFKRTMSQSGKAGIVDFTCSEESRKMIYRTGCDLLLKNENFNFSKR